MSSLVRFRFVALMGAISVLLVLAAPAAGTLTAAASSSAAAKEKAPERHGRLLRRRRPAAGHRREIRGPGPAADDVVVPEERHVGERQRAAHPGAAEHGRRLVQPRDRRVAGRPRLHQQHVPHQRPAVRRTARRRSTRTCSRPSRSPSPPSAAGSRSPRSSGPAAATPRSRARRSTSSRSSPAAASRRTSSARPVTSLFDDAPFIAAFGLQFDHPAGYAGQAPFPAPRRRPPTGWTGSCRRRSARRRRCACACSTSASTSTA